ncbi:MAG: glutamyl-tRNA reductase [Myxococcota bacterium]
MKIILLGMNHDSAPIGVREKLAVDDAAPLLQKLVSCDEIDEAVLFSTCNRVEVVCVTRSLEGARMRLNSFFRRDLAGDGLSDDHDLEELTYERFDGQAMRHVLRVASALDSMVIGEPQILGQTKDAYRTAVDCGATGPILGRLFQHAFQTAKRVRTETRIAERPVSIARVAVDLAKQIFEDFSEKRVLLIGAGEMIELALESLRREGFDAICVANRTESHAAELAAKYGASAHGLDELDELLADADVVLTSMAGDEPILTVPAVSAALLPRSHRPLFVIDIGVPRNADPEIDGLDNVFRYDLDDLSSVASQNAELRQRESERAETIVREEQQRLEGWFATLRAVPTINHLRERMESIRTGELERTLARLGLDEASQARVDALTKSIVNKILHVPITRLREEAEREEGMAYLEAVRALFDLDDDPTPRDRE